MNIFFNKYNTNCYIIKKSNYFSQNCAIKIIILLSFIIIILIPDQIIKNLLLHQKILLNPTNNNVMNPNLHHSGFIYFTYYLNTGFSGGFLGNFIPGLAWLIIFLVLLIIGVWCIYFIKNRIYIIITSLGIVGVVSNFTDRINTGINIPVNNLPHSPQFSVVDYIGIYNLSCNLGDIAIFITICWAILILILKFVKKRKKDIANEKNNL